MASVLVLGSPLWAMCAFAGMLYSMAAGSFMAGVRFSESWGREGRK